MLAYSSLSSYSNLTLKFGFNYTKSKDFIINDTKEDKADKEK